MTASINLSDLSHWFGIFQALSDINLDVGEGEYVTLLGPSGCGKTTLLSILGGFIEPSKGRVLINGKDMTHVAPAKRPTTTMFQDYALFPHMTLRNNVGFGPRMAGMGKRARDKKADEVLELVNLADSALKRPHELSGGQRQRVALARALAVEPDVLLLDEPLGALDLKLRRSMQDELKAIQRRIGTTFIHVTHDQEEAMAIADKIVVLNGGKVEDFGPPDRVYQKPHSLFTAGFMGETNQIPARSEAGKVQTVFGALDIKPPVDAGELVVFLRPEAISTGNVSGIDLGKAKVKAVAFSGTHCRVHLSPDASPDLTLLAHFPAGSPPDIGSVLELKADPSLISVFPKQ